METEQMNVSKFFVNIKRIVRRNRLKFNQTDGHVALIKTTPHSHEISTETGTFNQLF